MSKEDDIVMFVVVSLPLMMVVWLAVSLRSSTSSLTVTTKSDERYTACGYKWNKYINMS